MLYQCVIDGAVCDLWSGMSYQCVTDGAVSVCD